LRGTFRPSSKSPQAEAERQLRRPPLLLPILCGLWLLLLCWLAFFNGLGELGLMDKTEALFVEVGHQMLQRDDWVTPWWNGERFFDYPVWGYWMVALSFRLFGVSEWAARLPVALAASAVVVAAFALLLVWAPSGESDRARFGRAALGAGVLATTPGWIGWGRTSTTDMFLSSAIALALFGFLLTLRHPRHPRLAPLGRIGLAGFSGIAVLAKGPVGVLLPGLVIGVFLTLTGQWRRWLRGGPLLAMLLLFLGVCLPWYAAAARLNGMDFLGGFLGFSNLQRFTSVIYDHPGPPWFYLPWLLILLLPWSLFLPAAVLPLRFWRLDRWRRAAGEDVAISEAVAAGKPVAAAGSGVDQLGLFLLLWLGLILAFFSAAATKLPGYILPALPAASLLVTLLWRPMPAAGRAAVAGAREPAGWPIRLSGWIEAVLVAALAVAALLAPRWAAADPAHPGFAAALERSGLPLLLAVLLAALVLALLVLLVGPRWWPWLWVPNLAAFLAVLAMVIAPLAPLLDRERLVPLRQLATLAAGEAQPGEPLWVVGTKRYSILFYSGKPAVFVSGRGAIEERLRQDPGGLGLGPTSRSVRLLGDRSALEKLDLPPQRIQRLARRGEQELWRVPRQDLRP
jgi:4-amino-4-deoxy-L-arabinose transferase-like glycosyltransferase